MLLPLAAAQAWAAPRRRPAPAAPAPAPAAPAAAPAPPARSTPRADPAALLQRYDAIMGADSFDGTFEMTAHREDGSARTYAMRVVKSGESKARLWFSAPASVRGQEMLRQGGNIWVYMPNLKRALRLGSRDAFQGGDFNNGDVLRVNYADGYRPTLEANSGMEDVDLLELHARDDTTPYERIRLWLRRPDAMPVKSEYYTASGKLLRRGEFGDVRTFSGVRRPAKITMHNMLASQRFSVMEIKALDPHVTPAAALFVLDNMGR